MTSWYTWLKLVLGFGWSLWVRAFGKKRAKVLVGVGLVGSTLVAFFLEERF